MKSKIIPAKDLFEPVYLQIKIESTQDLAALYQRFHSEPLTYIKFVPKIRTTNGIQTIGAQLSDLVRERGLWNKGDSNE